MRKLLIAAGAAALLASPALAETIVIQQDPAPTGSIVVDEGPIPGEVVTYVRENPLDAAPVLEGRLVNGTIIPADVQLAPVRGYTGYSYFYQDGAPVIVDSNRRIVQIVR